jgi:hypothetical protein
MSLDRDRENVEATARKLFTYCAALRERIARYYGTMATAEKQAAFVAQRARLLTVMDACSEYIEYAQEESANSNLDYAPETTPLGELDAVAHREKLRPVERGEEGAEKRYVCECGEVCDGEAAATAHHAATGHGFRAEDAAREGGKR